MRASPAVAKNNNPEETMNDMPKVTQEMIDLYDHFTHVTTDKAA